MRKLILLMILLLMLQACSQNNLAPIIVTKVRTVKTKIPSNLLQTTNAPKPDRLKKVKVLKGSKELSTYLKDLYDAWWENTIRIQAIKKLVK